MATSLDESVGPSSEELAVRDPFEVRDHGVVPEDEEDTIDDLPPERRIWPIVSPRVRKVIEDRLEHFADQHFIARVIAAMLAAMIFVAVGCALYLLYVFAIGVHLHPLLFGAGYTVFFLFLVALASHLRERDPIEDYRDSEFAASSEVPYRRRRGLRGLPKIILYVPLVVGNALRRMLEPAPLTDGEALETALRLMPVLHEPLPLAQAEAAGVGGPDGLRRAVLLLHALGLADLRRDPTGALLLSPCRRCEVLLRNTDTAPPGTAPVEIGSMEQTIQEGPPPMSEPPDPA